VRPQYRILPDTNVHKSPYFPILFKKRESRTYEKL